MDHTKELIALAGDGSREARDMLVLENMGLVYSIARRYLGRGYEMEDLVQIGTIGLIKAIDKFDYDKGIKFETYASLRIRGAILDQIRKMDWIPRSLRQKQKKIDAAMSKLEAELGRPATDEEIAKEIGISEDEFISWQGQANVSNVISLDEFVEASGEKEVGSIGVNSFDTPEEVVEKDELKKLLAESLEALTDREQTVILLYYYEELTLKEISQVLEVSESRVSQLHTKALQKMKAKLGSAAGYVFGR